MKFNHFQEKHTHIMHAVQVCSASSWNILLLYGIHVDVLDCIDFLNIIHTHLRVILTMSNYCKYKLLDFSRLLSHADLHTIELSRTFHRVTHL